MPRPRTRSLLATLGLMTALCVPDAGARTPAPVEAVFGLPEFGDLIAISPDGRLIAYELKRKPDGIDPAAGGTTSRFDPSGVPGGIVGTRLQLLDTTTGKTITPCDPSGWSWGPSWSPDGRRLAMYTNSDRAVHLWVYEVGSGQCRKFSDHTIKARHWSGVEAAWTADGNSVLVPLRPSWETLPDGTVPERKVDLAQTAEVYAFKSKKAQAATQQAATQAEAPPAETGGMDQHYRFENNSDLAMLDVTTGQLRVLAAHDHPSRPSAGRISPSGRWVSYLSTYYNNSGRNSVRNTVHDLAIVPAQGGDPKFLHKALPVPEADYYRLSYQWHPREDLLVYLEDGKLWLQDLRGTEPSAPRQLGAGLGPLSDWPLAFTRDGRHVIVGVDPDTKVALAPRSRNIGIVPVDGGASWAPVFDGSRLDFDRLVAASPHFAWQPDSDQILLQTTERGTGKSVIHRVDLRSRQVTVAYQGEPLKLSRLSVAHADHRKAVIAHENFSTPLDLYAIQPDLRLGKRITRLVPALDAIPTGTLHTFESRVPQFDGSMRAVKTAVILPEGARRGDPVPGVVFFYPGGDIAGRAASSFAGGSTIGVPISLFTSRGYAAVLVSALTGPGNEPGHAFTEIVDSLLPQVYRAADLGYVDINRLGLTGQSFGGYSTAAILTRTRLFRAGVATNGAYNLTGPFYAGFTAKDNHTPGGMSWVEGSQPRIGTHIWSDMRRVIDNSPFHQADRIQTPLLLVQGMDDGGYVDAQMMFNALDRLGAEVEAAFYADSEHYIGTWPKANAIDAANRILDFFERHLGTP